jgi:predicted amidohydrolase
MIYGMPVAMANHCGPRGPFEFWGGSRILDAGGAELARAGNDESLIVARIDRADAEAARRRLPTARDADPQFVRSELSRVIAERAGR